MKNVHLGTTWRATQTKVLSAKSARLKLFAMVARTLSHVLAIGDRQSLQMNSLNASGRRHASAAA